MKTIIYRVKCFIIYFCKFRAKLLIKNELTKRTTRFLCAYYLYVFLPVITLPTIWSTIDHQRRRYARLARKANRPPW